MKAMHYFIALLFAAVKMNAWSEVHQPWQQECYATYFETPYRVLSNKDAAGYTFELDDGTIWRVIGSANANAVRYWRVNDTLVIHPTFAPTWSGGRYYILNERLNSAVTVEISLGPIPNTPTNNQITYIDYPAGILKLEDALGRVSFWRLNPMDRSLFETWRPGNSIILGSNQNCYAGWFSNDPYILINFERNQYVRATLQ